MEVLGDDDNKQQEICDSKHVTTVYLIIRRKKMTLYLDVPESTQVIELKKMIETIFKVQPQDQRLFIMFLNNGHLEEYQELSDSTAQLFQCGLTSSAAMISSPAIIGLAVRQEDGSFESLKVTPYSNTNWPMPPNDDDLEKCIAYNEKYAKMLEEFLEKGPKRTLKTK
ncbi:PREDICTED: transcription elongation factor B polypeptide 2-like [Trachymyrmex cornetzi]|nr:PREDICTED: transcription elongation factor B polypeptide 2-like [Trachymyrmex cornetzi]XP_018372156.1 PREDICTED: transcription elongation factor B polypeptide 2-like [Trachymyrmex cornetzi]XP_018372157.1 PREDICTED: transcription elongation factor B polypeptide 2-like [Trachymyrmex cornetzi]